MLLALLIGAVILLISGANPLEAYAALFRGAFGTPIAVGRTLEKATPLIFRAWRWPSPSKPACSTSALRGSYYLAPSPLPVLGFGLQGLPAVYPHSSGLVRRCAGWCVVCRHSWRAQSPPGAHEVITTIMLNYIAINITDYLADGPWKDTSPGNIVARTPKSWILLPPFLKTWRIPLGFFIAILAAFVVWWLLWKTTIGFEIRTVGLNPNAARYAGIKVAKTLILTMVIERSVGWYGRCSGNPGCGLSLSARVQCRAWVSTASPLPCLERPIPLASSRPPSWWVP